MSLNRVMVIGNLGANPELRYLQSGRAVANLSVATSDFFADPQGQKRHTGVEWHRVVVFGKLAENCHQYLQKGRQVYVEGRLRTRSFEIAGGDGLKGKRTEILATRVQFLGRAAAGEEPTDDSGAGVASSEE
jgi:single-strand DNA-binding protein